MNSILQDWTVPSRPTDPRQPGAAITRLELLGSITVDASIPLFAAIRAAREDTIEITIDSGGGSAVCALALFELLISHPRRVVANIVQASSGAAIVAMGADLRRVESGARILLHQTRASTTAATAEPLRSLLADLEALDDMSAVILAAATGHPPTRVAAWEREARTFDARAAIAAGLAHEVFIAAA